MMEHILAAILYADVVGYSRLTGFDEEKTHQKLNAGLNLLDDVISAHGGHKVHEAGDAILAEFQSVTEAVKVAVEFQRQMSKHNADVAKDDRLEFRVGVNLGEVIHDRDDIYGDDVNLAARIQELAEPGGVCISGTVYEQVNGKVDQSFDDLGYRRLKNIVQSIHVYQALFSDVPSDVKSQAPDEELNPFLSSYDALDRGSLITGRCMCGEVGYEISQPAIAMSLCHCSMCQRASGSPFAAWIVFKPETVLFTKTQPKYYKSSLIAERGFCANCGTSLTMRYYPEKPSDVLAILNSSMDHPEDFAPTYHLGVEGWQPWLSMHDALPRTQSEDVPSLRKRWEAVGVPNPADWR
jgi:class 3 adenylate cyclase